MRLAATLSLLALALVACSNAPRSDAGVDVSRNDTVADAPSPNDGAPPDDGVMTDPCVPNPCTQPNRTTCSAPLGIAECRCNAGYEEQSGQCVPVTMCTATTCSGHGECRAASGTLTCTCTTGYAGSFCERCDNANGYFDDGHGVCTRDPCMPNPCTQPERSLCTVASHMAVCQCNAGTHDDAGICVPDAMCTATTCAGHGMCSMTATATQCVCDTGWGGPHCDACDATAGYHADGAGGCTRDLCLPNPCMQSHRAVCSSDGVTTSCACDTGFHLEIDTCVPDETCTTSTCSSHGTCAVLGGRTSCTCDAGWTGPACAACASGYHDDGAGNCTMDPCLPNPCSAPSQTTCVAMGTTPTCTCDPGSHPDGTGGCTTDPCTPDPCVAMNQACRVVGTTAQCYTPPCDDGNPCTDDAVVAGRCTNTRRADGSTCSTGICRVAETCTAGVCGGGSARSCDDGNPCTRDTCVAPSGCTFTNDDTLVPADDGVACTAERCTAGMSQHVSTDSRCDDGRWCTGTEVCRPGGAGADARGCVTTSVPQPTSPNTPCRTYSCDEPSHSFTPVDRPVGASCNDGIACTTGDACGAGGVCAGSVTAACDPSPTAACTPGGSLVTTIDIGVAPVSGVITQGGAALSLTTNTYENGVVWARARDTGILHRLALIDWTRGGSYPNYTRTTGSDRIQTTLIPGVYDVLYQRALQTSGDYVSERGQSPTPDPVVNGYRIVQSGVVIPAGGRTLDVDIGATVLTGTITQNGAPLSLTTNTYENGVVWARARDTGKLHRLVLIDWTRGGSFPNYTRSAGSDQIRTMLVPGAYDILYQRALQSSGDYVSERGQSPAPDPVVNGYRVIAANVTISGASQVLNVDIGATVVTGTITMNGAPLPLTTNTYENGVVWARARDTGKLHRLVLVDWTRGGSYPNYTRSAGSNQINTMLVPGAYDILYQRALQSSGDYVSERALTPSPDTVVNGYRVIVENVSITGTSQVLNVDIGVTTVTGTITMNGGALPLTTNTYENGVVWARARDTGKLHRLVLIDWTRGGSYPNYTRTAGTDQINTALVPGAYDILYQRALQSSGNYVSERSLTPSPDPVVNGYRVLQENVTIAGASQVVNVDIGVTAVTGTVTQNGAPLSLTTNTYENGVVWARAQDTGRLHRLLLIDWTRGGSYPNYTRTTGTDRINTALVPGVYDILYQRALQSSGQYVTEQSLTPSPDPVVNGYRVIAANVTIGGASQVVNVDIPSVVVAGMITMNAAPLSLTTNTYENGVIWLRARDTGTLHRLALIDWTRGGSYPNYARTTGSDRFNSTFVPGNYDVLYQRAYQTSGLYVTQQNLTPSPDPVVNGYRVLQGCVLVN